MPAANRITPLLDTLALRLAATPLPAWWERVREDLVALLPARWRRLLAAEHRRLLLEPGADAVALVEDDAEGMRLLATLPAGDAELLAALRARLAAGDAAPWLLLPAAQVLRRRLALPAAAERRLREVLAFEIDRQTPFAPEQVSFQGRVLSRDPVQRSVQVELLVLPLARLQAAREALGPLANGLAGVDVRGEGGRPLGVDLLPAGDADRHRDPVRRLHALLALGGAVALVLALGLVRHNRAEALAALEARVAQAQAEVRDTRRLRNELQSAAQAANFLATTRAGRPTMLELIQDLTERIPDDTALDKLAVNDGRLVMVGQSAAAPALVGLLQASPLLRSPALAGAVQADPRGGRDRFTLTATVAGATPEANDGR